MINIRHYSKLYFHGESVESIKPSFLEALSMGIPYILTDFENAKEMIFNFKTRYFVESQKHTLFTAKIDSFLNKEIQGTKKMIFNFKTGYFVESQKHTLFTAKIDSFLNKEIQWTKNEIS